MAVARGIREVILAFVFMHPRGLEETVRVTSLQGLSVLIQDNHRTRCLCELQHIITHTGYKAGEGGGIGRSPELGLLVGSVTYVNIPSRSGLCVGLLNGSYTQGNMPLQLSAPQSAVVAVDLSVIVLEDTGVYDERFTFCCSPTASFIWSAKNDL